MTVIRRLIAGSTAMVYFLTNAVLAHSLENNIWTERRRRMENNRAGASDPLLLASLPAPSSPLARLPSLSQPDKASSALTDDLAKTLPAGFVAEHAALFGALHTAHGTIRKVWLPAKNAGDRIVVHIQDVHQNQEAQRHIGDVVDTLVQARQTELVALEAAFAPIDVKAYHDFRDRDVIGQTADCLLRENLITGPVHAFMTTSAVLPPLVGVDDRIHYDANVEAYRRSAPRVEACKTIIAAQKNDLERAKKAVFSKELLAFDAIVGAYKEERASLGDYVAALSPAMGMGQTGLLAEALAKEKKIDFQKVELDRKELIDALVKNLSKSQIDELIQKSAAYRAGEVRYGAFYRYLQSLCHSAKIELTRFPWMDAYIRYVMLSDRIDGEKLMGEMLALEKGRYGALAKTAEEKDLVARSNGLRLKERLLNFALTPVEWAEYEALKSLEGPSPAGGRGQGEGAHFADSFESFYQSAQARDDDMARNLLSSMDKGNFKQAVLVTGGYHTEGVSERLRAAGVTVVTFTPRIEKLDTAQGSAYLSIFTQEKTPLEKLFAGEKLFVSQLVAADYVVEKGGVGPILVTALVTLKGASSIVISETLRFFGADPEKFEVRVKNGVVTIKEWGQDARAAVQTIVQRTAEGNLTFKETVVVAGGVLLVALALFPTIQMALVGLIKAGLIAVVSIPGVSLLTAGPAVLASSFPGLSVAVHSLMGTVPTGSFSVQPMNSLASITTVAVGVTLLTLLLNRQPPSRTLAGRESSPASIIRRIFIAVALVVSFHTGADASQGANTPQTPSPAVQTQVAKPKIQAESVAPMIGPVTGETPPSIPMFDINSDTAKKLLENLETGMNRKGISNKDMALYVRRYLAGKHGLYVNDTGWLNEIVDRFKTGITPYNAMVLYFQNTETGTPLANDFTSQMTQEQGEQLLREVNRPSFIQWIRDLFTPSKNEPTSSKEKNAVSTSTKMTPIKFIIAVIIGVVLLFFAGSNSEASLSSSSAERIVVATAQETSRIGLPAPLADVLTAALPIPEARAGVPSIEQIEDPLQSYFQTRYKSFQDGWFPFQWMIQFERERFVRDFLLMDRGVVPVDDAWVGQVLEEIDFDSVKFGQLIDKIRSLANMAQPGTFVKFEGRNVQSGLSLDWIGNIKGAINLLFFSFFVGWIIPNYFRDRSLRARIDKLLPRSLINFIGEGKRGTRVGIYVFDHTFESAIETQCRYSRKKPEIITTRIVAYGWEDGGASPYDRMVIEVPGYFMTGENDYREFFRQFYPLVPVNGLVYFWAKPWVNEVLPDIASINRVFNEAGFVVMPESSSTEFIVQKRPDDYRRPTRKEILEDLSKRFPPEDSTSSYFLQIKDFAPFLALLVFDPFSIGFWITAAVAGAIHYTVDQYRIGNSDMAVQAHAAEGDPQAVLMLYFPGAQTMTAVDGRTNQKGGGVLGTDTLARLSAKRIGWSPYAFGQRAALGDYLRGHPNSVMAQGPGAIFGGLMRAASGERATSQQTVPLVVMPVATTAELAEAVAHAESLAELSRLSPNHPAFLAVIPDGEIKPENIRAALGRTGLNNRHVFIFDEGVTLESLQDQVQAATQHFGVDPDNVIPIVTRALEISARSKFDLSAVRSLPDGLSRNILLMLLNQLITLDAAAVRESLNASVRTAQLSKKSA